MSKKTKKKPVRKMSHPSPDRIVRFEASLSAKQAELINKHNDLASTLAGVEAVIKHFASATAAEVGKIHGTIEGHGMALSGLDLNILAAAEVIKDLVFQNVKMSYLLNKLHGIDLGTSLVDADAKNVADTANQMFTSLVSAGFKTVRERLEAEAVKDKEKREAEAKAKAEATEGSVVGEELVQAQQSETKVVGSRSGGAGAEFPEGAQIFEG